MVGLVKPLFLQLTITLLPLIWVAADFAETRRRVNWGCPDTRRNFLPLGAVRFSIAWVYTGNGACKSGVGAYFWLKFGVRMIIFMP